MAYGTDVTSGTGQGPLLPVLGGYPAKQCPRRVHNAFDPMVPPPPEPPDSVKRRMEDGRTFEQKTILPLLSQTFGPESIVIYGDHLLDKQRRIDETVALMEAGASVIVGGQLPDDEVGGRTGSPDLLYRVSRAYERALYVPADIKHHRTLDTSPNRFVRVTGLDKTLWEFNQPLVVQGWSHMTSHRRDDAMQLAHYTRMLQAMGRHANDQFVGGVLGTSDFTKLTGQRYGVVWHDLTKPLERTRSNTAERGWANRSILDVYDHEFAFRQKVAEAARTGAPALVEPFGKAECDQCPYKNWCTEAAGPNDASFAITVGRLSDREWRYLYDHDLHTIEALAAATPDGDLLDGFVRTVPQLNTPERRLTTAIHRAQMVRDQVLLERTSTGPLRVPIADVEIDFDVEWHPADGHVYQWGARVRQQADDATATYEDTVLSFEPLDDRGAQALADDFFDWLEEFVADHENAGRSVAIYHWTSPEVTKTIRTLGAERAEALFERFLDLRKWMDEEFFARDGLSLKVVAPIFGFKWRAPDAGGETSVLKIEQARDTADPAGAKAARDWLLAYNEDDCAAQAAIRDGLRSVGGMQRITESHRLSAPAQPSARPTASLKPTPVSPPAAAPAPAQTPARAHDENPTTATRRPRMAVAKPLSWNEIRENAVRFVAEWRGETRENAEAQSFWNDWFAMLGIVRRRFVQYEQKATRQSTGGRGRIDAFWEGQVAVEHKSAGKSLAEAEAQALDYLNSLGNVQQPRLVITSDFANFRVLDLELGKTVEFPLEELPNNIERFGFLAGYESRTFKPEDKVNIEAAEMMGGLYDALNASGYSGHDLKVFLVRLMFMLFADDTGVWEKGLFEEFLETRTSGDGSDVGPLIERLFQVLDTPEPRGKNLDEILARFPYVNGGLFHERINIPDFDRALRQRLIECSTFDWSAISPAIFGSMFQSVMDKKARRALGAHYTSEANIMKVLEPLFLDELRAEFDGAQHSVRRLEALRTKLGTLTFFDPAAGCGNFLVIAYREIRSLEFDILVRLNELNGDGQQHLDIDAISQMSNVNVDQFYGIEYEEFPARIAETAIYLVDHLENMRLSKQFGQYFARIPLRAAAHIHIGNALTIDWNTVLPAKDCTYLLGNPPFVGALLLDKEQSRDRRDTFAAIPEAKDLRAGRLDYVMCWYAKACTYLQGTKGLAAFVSTNSITQGEQGRSLTPLLVRLGFEIDFAHRTFQWSSEARGKAAVHVVIIGFSHGGRAKKALFDYPDIRLEPVVTAAKHINAYLVDAPDVFLAKRRTPFVAGLPVMTVGSQPTDGGHLIIEPDAYGEAMSDPIAAKYVRPLIGADGMLHDRNRWCLWLTDAAPEDLRQSPFLKDRIQKVATSRAESKTDAFRKCPPHLFTHRKQPTTDWIAIPRHSSENRRVIPMEIHPANDVAHDSLMMIKGADLWVFALLQSGIYTTWNRNVDGRIKSDLRISADMSYNAFPFPNINDTAKARLNAAAQAVLDARSAHPSSTLADLYDRAATPLNLSKAHDALDRVVDGLYGFRKVPTEAERSVKLFQRYIELTSGLLA